MGKKKKGGKGKKKLVGQKKKKIVLKTCGECFTDFGQGSFTTKMWSKKSMDAVCKVCEKKETKKKKSAKDSRNQTKTIGKKVEKKEVSEKVKLEMGDLPIQFKPDPEVKKTEEQKKFDEIRAKQTEDPSIAIGELFKESGLPPCEIVDHPGSYNVKLSKDEEFKKKMVDKCEVYEKKLPLLREAAEAHRQVRVWAIRAAKPGVKLVDLCRGIEERVHKVLPYLKLKGGFAFPVGMSLNSVAAHFTPNPGDETVIKKDDVLKIDIGLHINGTIIDSAFTLSWDTKYDNLLKSVRDATNVGVAECGIDVRLCDIGSRIQEVMESYEVELDGEVYPVKTIENLNGHSLGDYIVHSGITIPAVQGGPHTKVQEGDLFAIETFGSIMGNGRVADRGECSHFMKYSEVDDNVQKGIRVKKAKTLLEKINRNYKTLCFCPRWIPKIWNEKNYMVYLRNLVKNDIVKEYPPLCDKMGSYVAQYEHTLMMLPLHKEIFSRGDDF